MGERCEGMLVCVLVRVLVLVLVLVELGPQVRRGAQGSPTVSTLRGQEACVQLLSQDVLLWKERKEGELFPSLWTFLAQLTQEIGFWGAAETSHRAAKAES